MRRFCLNFDNTYQKTGTDLVDLSEKQAKVSKLARNGQTVRFTGVILKRKINFKFIFPTRKVSRRYQGNFFIAKSEPKLDDMGEKRAKNARNHP